jgi:hypothetical protein
MQYTRKKNVKPTPLPIIYTTKSPISAIIHHKKIKGIIKGVYISL